MECSPPPSQVSAECQDLITKLLIKDPEARLGSVHGADDIKAHPWFADVNWALVRNEAPPYIPKRGASKASSGGSKSGGGGSTSQGEPSLSIASDGAFENY